MNILFAASECEPFIKTGGLADVVGALPAELERQGADARVVLPKYRGIDAYWQSRMEHLCHFEVLFGWESCYCGVERVIHNDVCYYFIDNESFFAVDAIYGDGLSEGLRFAFFCRAVLEMLAHIDFSPAVLHCNDWQTGLIPALLKNQYAERPGYESMKAVFSIHNLRYQGLFDWREINGRLGLPEWLYSPEYLEFYGNMSCMKAGLVFADKLLTVSPSYAEEIKMPYYGEQLDGLLRHRAAALSGILNGIDTVVYDPGTDRFLSHHYTMDGLAGKAQSKAALQAECGLAKSPTVPLIGFVARLSSQKGLDLIERVLDDIMRLNVQLVFLGKGEKRFEDMLHWASWRYGGRVHARAEQDEGLAHRIYAGADMFLMPSQYEPCGLSQMIALRYGTVPIVRETGGLKDSVVPYNRYTDDGTGFSFANYNAHEMLDTIERAVAFYEGDKALWQRLQRRGMALDFSWTQAAGEYRRLYDSLFERPAAESPAGPQPDAPAPALSAIAAGAVAGAGAASAEQAKAKPRAIKPAAPLPKQPGTPGNAGEKAKTPPKKRPPKEKRDV